MEKYNQSYAELKQAFFLCAAKQMLQLELLFW